MAERRRSPEEVAKSMAAAKKLAAVQTLKKHRSSIKNAKIALLVIGGLQILFGLVEGFGSMKSMLAFAIDGGIGGIFIALYFLAEEKPVLAFRIGLIFYCSVIVLLAVFSPFSIASGFLMKVIVIGALVGGMRAVGKIPKQFNANDELLDEVPNPLDEIT